MIWEGESIGLGLDPLNWPEFRFARRSVRLCSWFAPRFYLIIFRSARIVVGLRAKCNTALVLGAHAGWLTSQLWCSAPTNPISTYWKWVSGSIKLIFWKRDLSLPFGLVETLTKGMLLSPFMRQFCRMIVLILSPLHNRLLAIGSELLHLKWNTVLSLLTTSGSKILMAIVCFAFKPNNFISVSSHILFENRFLRHYHNRTNQRSYIGIIRFHPSLVSIAKLFRIAYKDKKSLKCNQFKKSDKHQHYGHSGSSNSLETKLLACLRMAPIRFTYHNAVYSTMQTMLSRFNIASLLTTNGSEILKHENHLDLDSKGFIPAGKFIESVILLLQHHQEMYFPRGIIRAYSLNVSIVEYVWLTHEAYRHLVRAQITVNGNYQHKKNIRINDSSPSQSTNESRSLFYGVPFLKKSIPIIDNKHCCSSLPSSTICLFESIDYIGSYD